MNDEWAESSYIFVGRTKMKDIVGLEYIVSIVDGTSRIILLLPIGLFFCLQTWDATW